MAQLKETSFEKQESIFQYYSQKLNLEQKTIQAIQNKFNKFISLYRKSISDEEKHLFILAIFFLSFKENNFEALDQKKVEHGKNIVLSDIIKIMDINVPLNVFFKKIKICWQQLVQNEDDNNNTEKTQFDEKFQQLEKELETIEGKSRIYYKFNQIFNGLQVRYEEKGGEGQDSKGYLQDFKCFSWLLYLHSQEEICNKQEDDIYIKNIYILQTACMYSFIGLPDNYISNHIREKKDLELQSQEIRFQNKEIILKTVQDLFNSTDMSEQSQKYYSEKFLDQIQDFLTDLFENVGIKITEEEEQKLDQLDQERKTCLLISKCLKENDIQHINEYMKKEYSYNLQQNYEDFDETCFLKIQKVMAPRKNQIEGIFPNFSKNSGLQSHRHLDFKENPDNSQGNILKQNLKDSVPKPKTPQIPYEKMQQTPKAKVKQFPETPISVHLTNIKWLNFYSNESPTQKLDFYLEQIQPGNKQKLKIDLKQKILRWLEKKAEDEKINSQQKGLCTQFFENQFINQQNNLNNQNNNNTNIKNKNQQDATLQNNQDNAVEKIVHFYFNILEKMIVSEEKVLGHDKNKSESIKKFLDDPEFLFGLLTLCICTHYYIQYQNKDNLIVQGLLPICGASALDVYRILSNFAQFDKDMPQNIKERLFNIERQLLLYNVFQEDGKIDVVNMVEEFFNKDEYLKKKVPPKNPKYYQVFCKRLFQHMALRVFEACIELEIRNEKLQNKVWSIIKHILEKQQDLLRSTSIDYLIICSIYIIYIKYKDLFQRKLKLIEGDDSIVKNYHRLEFFQKHVINIRESQENKNESLTKLKHFYNNTFLPPIKKFVNDDQTALERVLTKKQELLLSPLTFSIPKPFYQYSPCNYKGSFNTSHFKPATTPQMQQKIIRMGETIESPNIYFQQNKKVQQQGFNTPSVYLDTNDENNNNKNNPQNSQQFQQQQLNGEKQQNQARNLFKKQKVNSNRKLNFVENLQENNNDNGNNSCQVEEVKKDMEEEQLNQKEKNKMDQNINLNNKTQQFNNNNNNYNNNISENSNTKNSMKSPKFGAQSQISNSSINNQIQMEFAVENFSSQNDKSFASFKK